MNLPPEISFAPKEVQAHYLAMIADGQSETFAAMCALQQPPGTKGSDRAFMQGRNNQEWLNEMPERQAKYIVAEAKAAGIDITGKYYHSGIADKRGWTDPKAWISDSSDLLAVAKERNLEVQGAVSHKAVEMEPKKDVALSKDLETQFAAVEKKKNPKLSDRAARSVAREKYAPRWKKKRS